AASQKRLNEFLMTEPTQKSPANAKKIDAAGDIVFKDVDFTYPDTGIQALKNFNLHIKTGEKVALVGKTGSGKSTVAQLLLRMYDVTSGTITIDSVDIRHADLLSLREQISYVPQDVFLFSETVGNNIRFGRTDVNEEQIIEAATMAHIHAEIDRLPQKYDTQIGERGVMLSGGQKQRISIARALIRDDAGLVIFDDCLSAVDARTERRISANLNQFLKEKTAIVITHRMFSLMDFDKIIVLQDGRIIEQGTHKELVGIEGGYYRGVYESQQRVDR